MLRQLLTAATCVLWVVGSVSMQLHDIFNAHVVCAEHGVVEHVELADGTAQADATAQHDDGPAISAADTSDHGEACPLQGIPSFGPAIAQASLSGPPLVSWLPPDPLVVPGAPRGPPLAYAPKTSPPVAS